MGTRGVLYRKSRGVWFIDYIAADGRRIREAIGPGEENRRLACKILAQREAEATLGQHRVLPQRTPRFGEYADEWYARKEPNLRPSSRESYSLVIKRYLTPAFGEMRLGARTRGEIEAAMLKIPSPAVANYSLRLLRSILRDAVKRECIAKNPADDIERRQVPDDGEEVLQVLTPDQIGRLLAAAREPYRTLYQTAIFTGLRRGELLGLRWGDLDLRKRLLYVRRSLGPTKDEAPVKTKGSRRMIDLSPDLVERLEALRQEQGQRTKVIPLHAGDEPDYVFCSRAGTSFRPNHLVQRRFKRHLRAAGLPAIRFHDLRHTYASLLVRVARGPEAARGQEFLLCPRKCTRV